jgi:hypothetical protein
LPTLTLEKDEENDIKDLEIRLNILSIIRDISQKVESVFCTKILFKKIFVKKLTPKFSPDIKITKQNIKFYAQNIINTFPKFEEKKEAKIKKTISLEDTMNNLINRIKRNISMSFKDFTGNKKKIFKVDKFDYNDTYGLGFSYTNILPLKYNRRILDKRLIKLRIKRKFYDLIIFSEIHKTKQYLAKSLFYGNKVFIIDSEDDQHLIVPKSILFYNILASIKRLKLSSTISQYLFNSFFFKFNKKYFYFF